MNKFLPLIIFMCFTHNINAQVVSSSCMANDTVSAYYKTDAQMLALSCINKYSSNYKDSTIISQQWTDTALKALLAVYNCGMPQCDTVASIYKIHTSPDGVYSFYLNRLNIYVDKKQQWVKDILNGVTPNSNTSVNNLLNKYHFTQSFIFYDLLELTSDSNYNMNAVAKLWQNVPGTDTGLYAPRATSLHFGEEDDISVDTVTSDYTSLTFKHGWSDCPSGCICRRYWNFKVYKNCDVAFVKSWGGDGSHCALNVAKQNKIQSQVSPNPFNETIAVKTKDNTPSYKVFNLAGQIIIQGILSTSGIINMPDVPKGVYTLQLCSTDGVQNIKLIKQ